MSVKCNNENSKKKVAITCAIRGVANPGGKSHGASTVNGGKGMEKHQHGCIVPADVHWHTERPGAFGHTAQRVVLKLGGANSLT